MAVPTAVSASKLSAAAEFERQSGSYTKDDLASKVIDHFLSYPESYSCEKALDTIPWHLIPSSADMIRIDDRPIVTPSEAAKTSKLLSICHDIWTQASDDRAWLPARSLLISIPRICIILNVSRQYAVVEEFLSARELDHGLPFSRDRLLSVLHDDNSTSQFLEAQKCALVREIPPGGNVTLQPGELLPLKYISPLGQGGTGRVDIVENVFTGERTARKIVTITVSKRRADRILRSFEGEISSLKRLTSHQHIVKFAGSYTSGNDLALLLLPIAEFSLQNYLALPASQCDSDMLLRCFGCLSSALAFMHDLKIRHKDIKPANILVCGSDILFTDFGLAYDFSQSSSSTTGGQSQGLTRKYAAPEVSKSEKRGRRSDVFSLGCVFLEIATVLAGKTVVELEDHLEGETEDSDYQDGLIYHEHHEEIMEWIRQLSQQCPDVALALPLRWCATTLAYKADHRPYVSVLIQTVAEDTRPSKVTRPTYFCHTCLEELKQRKDATAANQDLEDDSDNASDLGFEGDDDNGLADPLSSTAAPILLLESNLRASSVPVPELRTLLSSISYGSNIPFVITQIFEQLGSCVRLYYQRATARNMPVEHRFLQVNLALQLIRILSCSEALGLSRGVQRPSRDLLLNQSLILNILTQQTSLLEAIGTFEEVPPHSIDQIWQDTSSILFATRESKKLLDDILRPSSSSRGSVESIQLLGWKVFDPSDQEHFVISLKKLGDLNRDMRSMLDKTANISVQSKDFRTDLEMCQATYRVDDLRDLLKACTLVQPRPAPHQTPELLENSANNINPLNSQPFASLASLVRFKLLSAAIDQDELDETLALELGMDLSAQSIFLDERDVKLTPGEHELYAGRNPELATYSPPNLQPKRVWIEWKEYDPETEDDREVPPVYILSRVRNLATLLSDVGKPAQFRVPHCLGYFDDHSSRFWTRFGLVFEIPKGYNTERPPISLLELIRGSKSPGLTKRVALAKAIANSLLFIHSTNWLHKGLRSENIIFLDPGPSEGPSEGLSEQMLKRIDLTQPYITGFDYSRPARDEEMTERPPENPEFDIYRHPRAHGDAPKENFKMTFDIYSLGVVLVEIAHWKRIDKIIGIDDLSRAKPNQTKRVQLKLLTVDSYLEDIRDLTGDVYVQVVRACLIGGSAFGLDGYESEASVAGIVQMLSAFRELVVGGLDSIRT